MLRYHIMTEPEKRQVCARQYDGEYAAYNLPDYTEMQKRQMGFCNPDRRKNFTPIVMTPGWSDSPTCSRKKRRSLSASAFPPAVQQRVRQTDPRTGPSDCRTALSEQAALSGGAVLEPPRYCLLSAGRLLHRRRIL